jgi:hypothetical protein
MNRNQAIDRERAMDRERAEINQKRGAIEPRRKSEDHLRLVAESGGNRNLVAALRATTR